MHLMLFSGFRGTHCPPPLRSHGIEDNTPDANDESDFDIDEQGRFASAQVSEVPLQCICL